MTFFVFSFWQWELEDGVVISSSRLEIILFPSVSEYSDLLILSPTVITRATWMFDILRYSNSLVIVHECDAFSEFPIYSAKSKDFSHIIIQLLSIRRLFLACLHLTGQGMSFQQLQYYVVVSTIWIFHAILNILTFWCRFTKIGFLFKIPWNCFYDFDFLEWFQRPLLCGYDLVNENYRQRSSF